MADVSTAAVSGSLKVGLHIVSNYKRPVLEIYHQVFNMFSPEEVLKTPVGLDGMKTRKLRTRFQDVFVQFSLINIGGVRAENIELNVSGSLRRNHPGLGFGGSFKKPIPQLAPGQVHYLFRIDAHDLLHYPEGDGMPSGVKEDTFTITICYNPPPGILNWILGLSSRRKGKKRFTTTYTFSPQLVEGDLPPPQYAT